MVPLHVNRPVYIVGNILSMNISSIYIKTNHMRFYFQNVCVCDGSSTDGGIAHLSQRLSIPKYQSQYC